MTSSSRLGAGLFVLFLVCAGVIYALSGWLGWESNVARALLAFILGPLLATVLFALGWMYVTPSTPVDDQPTQPSEE